MSTQRLLVYLAILLGIIFVLVGLTYATHTAAALPSYFPGHEAGLNQIHVKHTVAAFLLAIACFVYAWFGSGKKTA